MRPWSMDEAISEAEEKGGHVDTGYGLAYVPARPSGNFNDAVSPAVKAEPAKKPEVKPASPSLPEYQI